MVIAKQSPSLVAQKSAPTSEDIDINLKNIIIRIIGLEVIYGIVPARVEPSDKQSKSP
jgi:hypothetical protein